MGDIAIGGENYETLPSALDGIKSNNRVFVFFISLFLNFYLTRFVLAAAGEFSDSNVYDFVLRMRRFKLVTTCASADALRVTPEKYTRASLWLLSVFEY